MGRPTAKTDLLTAATANYEKLNTLVSELTEKELSTSFDFSGDEKRKKLIGKEIKIFVIFSFISMNGISFC
mgnify:FL=1